MIDVRHPTLAVGVPPVSTSTEPSDQRGAARRRVLLSGKLAYGNGFSADCLIRDQSETGARVVVSTELIPHDLVLIFVTQATAYEAEVVWRRGNEVGLRLGHAHALKPGSAGDETQSSLKLARKLWAEAAAR